MTVEDYAAEWFCAVRFFIEAVDDVFCPFAMRVEFQAKNRARSVNTANRSRPIEISETVENHGGIGIASIRSTFEAIKDLFLPLTNLRSWKLPAENDSIEYALHRMCIPHATEEIRDLAQNPGD